MRIWSRLNRHFALVTNIALLLLGLVYIQYCRDGVVEYKHYIHGYSRDVLTQIGLYSMGVLLVVFGRTIGGRFTSFSAWHLPLG